MERLVILGGGYGGLKLLSSLLEERLPDNLEITVIDRNPYHSLKTEFYTIAAGTSADRDVRKNFPKDERINYIFGEIAKIDIVNEQILIKNRNKKLQYNYLIIALGCEDNYHNVGGAKEFTESVQSFTKARYTGLAVGNLKAYGKVSVVGAGLSGIEVASEIRESRPDLNIKLLDRGEAVLSSFDTKIQEYVKEWFEKNDVEILHRANVEYVEKGAVCNNGVCYDSDVTIWTAGVRPNHLVRTLPFEKDEYEKVVINEYFQVPSHQNVYVIGDCASSVHSPSAQLAQQQGEQVAKVLLSVLRGETPKKPGEIKLKGTLGALGKSDGFGNMFQRPVTGLMPRLAKSGVLWLNKRH